MTLLRIGAVSDQHRIGVGGNRADDWRAGDPGLEAVAPAIIFPSYYAAGSALVGIACESALGKFEIKMLAMVLPALVLLFLYRKGRSEPIGL